MMRAKLVVQAINQYGDPPTTESLSMSAVSSNPYGPNGESEDNTFARYTPAASFTASITNPALIGKFRVGQKFYLDFIEAPE